MKTIDPTNPANADWMRWLNRVETKQDLLDHLAKVGSSLEEFLASGLYAENKDTHPVLKKL